MIVFGMFFLASSPKRSRIGQGAQLHPSMKPKSGTLGGPSPGYPNVLSNFIATRCCDLRWTLGIDQLIDLSSPPLFSPAFSDSSVRLEAVLDSFGHARLDCLVQFATVGANDLLECLCHQRTVLLHGILVVLLLASLRVHGRRG